MKRKNGTNTLAATPEELRLIARLTERPAFARLADGELEIVQSDDWSDVPDLIEGPAIRLPKSLYRKMAAISRKRRTTPDRLASRWLTERLSNL